MMLQKKKVLFIGAGSMAEAIAAGIVQQNKVPPNHITMTNKQDEQRRVQLMKDYHVISLPIEETEVQEADLIVLAMKPKDAASAIAALAPKLLPHQLLLSVIAGVTTTFLEGMLPLEQPVIRVMPNTSSTIGESITALTPGVAVSADHLQLARTLFESIGGVTVINEQQMDVFTGIAGSGPAYIYYVLEHMEETAKQEGIPPELAREIVAQTVLGASKMVLETKTSPRTLRKKVTSPNGTTAAGVDALKQHGAGMAFTEAILRAKNRSTAIAKELEMLHS
ncbi:pyrroline-5-carboxylate reductase [Fictibacillus macauensis ZFHKF-1]|uniref:Pyrroline-5-carboxylate reductase n=1 Tax=Fictibacillus macauensis ZFHKF-1 TaxID=1196324 RepID=I8ALK4_9BACL|nr:pyrroline-5-carboxylate reductase [Fictibacillus macauensis]EIT86797.1 pyrroline-5-carboxylate reductase [Fictibacillus macauensis ZFHKF-1]